MQHLSIHNKSYPDCLKNIPQPPKEIFINGDLNNLLEKPAVGVVGSRKVSSYGRNVTELLVKKLCARGVIIVSGLALGVDSIAHQTALDVGGVTIAVLPSGLDNIYPSSHYNIAKNIVRCGGALVSEYPPKTEAFKSNFIARNRLISGLSKALLITEAAINSGSLHTANFAIDQGIDVLAVPGPITSQFSAGCNNLIKSGAIPVTDVDDILNCLHINSLPAQEKEIHANNPSEHAILNLLIDGAKDGDYLLSLSNLEVKDFQQTMSFLEISGKIKSVGGNIWVIQ
jgi:DNA processing protein